MKTLLRNHMTIYYALPGSAVEQTDQYGNYTGVTAVTYGEPVKYTRLSTRNRNGGIREERFGLTEDYVDSFVTDDMSCPITVDTHLWIGVTPKSGTLYTHVVQAVLPSLNVIRIVAKEVSVS